MLIALDINNEAMVDCRVMCRAQPRPVDDLTALKEVSSAKRS